MKKHETHYRRHCVFERIMMGFNMPVGSDQVDAQWRLREMEPSQTSEETRHDCETIS